MGYDDDLWKLDVRALAAAIAGRQVSALDAVDGKLREATGALAAAMGEMVVNYSIGKKDLEAFVDELKPALQQATVLRLPREQLAQWLQPAAGRVLEDHLYVVDPMGNWMMRFPARLDRKGAARAKRDLERLMRASAGWDKPGRPGD